MFLRLPASDQLTVLRIDDRDGRFAPQADKQSVARFIPGEAVWIGIDIERPLPFQRSIARLEFRNGVPEDIRHPQRQSVVGKGQSRGGTTLFFGERFGIANFELAREQSL